MPTRTDRSPTPRILDGLRRRYCEARDAQLDMIAAGRAREAGLWADQAERLVADMRRTRDRATTVDDISRANGVMSVLVSDIREYDARAEDARRTREWAGLTETRRGWRLGL